ncbi:MAG: ABC transporter ATP-binding protein [Kordiimonadaceae bacterium]|nr:ABC transporter ATP-binding protein [Kordiimonadaceae bacterium]
MTNLAIECSGVGKTYKEFTLKDIDLTLEKGQVMGFIGPNGAGKSTTIRILMGMVAQDVGDVRVLGHRMPDEQADAKRNIGYVSEDMRLFPTATLAWHMAFMQKIYPGWNPKYADELLRRFDLKSGQKMKGMSHGQRVKSTLLLALARFPTLLILDEPTTGLDPVARQEVLGAMMEVLADEERTILFSSHNTQDVEQLADSITFIDQGQVISSLPKDAFMENWRRVRLEVPQGTEVPQIPGVKQIQHSGSIAVVTTSSYTDETASLLSAEGGKILGTDTMTLEEIFIADVSASRGRAVP